MVKHHPMDSAMPAAKRFRAGSALPPPAADPAIFFPPSAGLQGLVIGGRFFITSDKPIGKGTGGDVWTCVDVTLPSSPVFAIKKLKGDNPSREPAFTHVPAIAQNPNFASPQATIQDSRFPAVIFVVTRLQHGGDLRQFLRKSGPMSSLRSRSFMAQLIIATHQLHEAGFIHRDLKPENLFFPDEIHTQLVIGDFGLARDIPQNGQMSPQMQTLWYRAPEVLLGSREYTEKADIFSLGAIFAELLKGKPILKGNCELDQLKLVFGAVGCPQEGSWPEMESYLKMFRSNAEASDTLADILPFGTSPELLCLISRMMEPLPEKRISLVEILEHPFFINEPIAIDWRSFNSLNSETPIRNPTGASSLAASGTKRRRSGAEEEPSVDDVA